MEQANPAQTPIVIEVANVSAIGQRLRDLDTAMVYVGRSAWPVSKLKLEREIVLANPFKVDQHGRGVSILRFTEDLIERLRKREQPLLDALTRLSQKAKQHGSLTCVCHCAPRACHSENIASLMIGTFKTLGIPVKDRTPFTCSVGVGVDQASVDAIVRSRSLITEYIAERAYAREQRMHNVGAIVRESSGHESESKGLGFER